MNIPFCSQAFWNFDVSHTCCIFPTPTKLLSYYNISPCRIPCENWFHVSQLSAYKTTLCNNWNPKLSLSEDRIHIKHETGYNYIVIIYDPCLMNSQTKLSTKLQIFYIPLLSYYKTAPNVCQLNHEHKHSTSLWMLQNQTFKHCSLLPKWQNVSMSKLFTKFNIKYCLNFSQLLDMPGESQSSDPPPVFCERDAKCITSFKC